jgi:hypothetical protein
MLLFLKRLTKVYLNYIIVGCCSLYARRNFMSEFDNIIPSVLNVKAAEGVEILSEDELTLTEGKSIAQLLEDEEKTEKEQNTAS